MQPNKTEVERHCVISKLRAAQIELLLLVEEDITASDLRRVIERLEAVIKSLESKPF
jgi:hypothetical protein